MKTLVAWTAAALLSVSAFAQVPAARTPQVMELHGSFGIVKITTASGERAINGVTRVALMDSWIIIYLHVGGYEIFPTVAVQSVEYQ